MDEIRDVLPLLLPIIAIQFGLIVWALVDLARRERTRGPKWLWALVILLGNFLGPIVYFLVGREEA